MHTLRFVMFAALALASATASEPVMTQAAAAPAQNTVAVPGTHHRVGQRPVSVDGVSATLTRYERRDGRNAGLGGEHFSILMAADGRLKGFVHLSLDLAGKPLPSAERSEQMARQFLRTVAPDLLAHMRVTSVEPHSEPIDIVRNGRRESVQITGMRVKARNTADGSWFWIVIGGDEEPMLFERDLQWSNLRFRRATEEWLYDRWLQQR